MGILYLVATPIGNLEDISMRSLRTLREVKLIAAEDTRHTRKLLSYYDIHTPMMSFYEHNQSVKTNQVLSALDGGDVALVSDAGTPNINDPGFELVRAAIAQGFQVSPIPGACAPIAALIASGLPTDSFLYLGYLPRKAQARYHALQSVEQLPYTLIFLETPHRFLESLLTMQEVLGERSIAVARELTKLHEEFFFGTFSEAHQHFSTKGVRGEFSLVVSGNNHPLRQPGEKIVTGETQPWQQTDLLTALQQMLEQGETPSQAAARLAKVSGWARRDIYRLAALSAEER